MKKDQRNRAVGSVLICITGSKQKQKHRNSQFSSKVFNFSVFEAIGQIVVRLRQSLCCQKQSWRLRQVHHLHHTLVDGTEGQDVVLKILEAFVNR